jgi:hypothetical protein
MGIACSLIGIAIFLFLAKSKIPNADLERLANITSIIIFVFGVLSLILPLPAINEIVLLNKQPTPTADYNVTNSALTTYKIPLTSTSGCELKEFVAFFDSGETLFVDYKFPTGFFSGTVASHVGFMINGADFEDAFRVDEVLSYSTSHTVTKPGEYRIGFIWHGRYEREVTAILPTKNWQIVVSECSEK